MINMTYICALSPSYIQLPQDDPTNEHVVAVSIPASSNRNTLLIYFEIFYHDDLLVFDIWKSFIV